MSLFQNSVYTNYLKSQDQEAITNAFEKLKIYQSKAEKISEYKEEEYQDGFLRDVFVDVLGYTFKYDSPDSFNLLREKKNENDGKKADGAILKGGDVFCVIELKDTNTKKLSDIELQAFGYQSGHVGCDYVVISNFAKLNFYIKNKIDKAEFDLFNCDFEQFQELWICLQVDNLLDDLPQKIKNDSVVIDEQITKELYKDYSDFKSSLWENLVKNHPDEDPLILYKESQKLLDRFLFIFFGEDKGLLPTNSISKIVDQWSERKEDWSNKDINLFDRFKEYFDVLNTGWKDKIFAYNGGLFKPNPFLEKLKVDDDVLHPHVMKLTSYDFDSKVDVNILGHIFEHSLSEIEEIEAKLLGQEVDTKKSKRKKDGVFYTPRYITEYIVDNTIGKLCMDKKKSLGILDEEYAKGRRNRKKEIIKKLDANLQEYRNWLLNITICDPACGSGAFLNQALNFLIMEHAYIEELEGQLHSKSFNTGTQLALGSNVENHILENNLFGVDINEESIEIAKLALWLRTAKAKRKLTTLSNNIKCGNSLLDDTTVDPVKAFDWKKSFPSVFSKGGFDVIIGNPPYLRVQGLRENFEKESDYYENTYFCAKGRFDIYSLFIERSTALIKNDGLVSFILPHKFLIVDAGNGIREFLQKNQYAESIVHFGEEMVFQDASVYTCIINLSHGNDVLSYKRITPSELLSEKPFDSIQYKDLGTSNWNLIDQIQVKLIEKISIGNPKVKDVFDLVGAGIDAGADDIFMLTGKYVGKKFVGFSTRLEKDVELESGIVKPLLKGEDVKGYATPMPVKFILYPHYFDGKKTKPYEEDEFMEKFPLAFAYMSEFKDEMVARKERKKTNIKYWYTLHRSRDITSFENDKIITPEISLGTNMTFDTRSSFHNTKVYYLIKKAEVQTEYKYLLGILNSSLMWYYLKTTGYVLRGGYFTFKTKFMEPFPISLPDGKEDEQYMVKKVDHMLQQTQKCDELISDFLTFLGSHFKIDGFSKKIQSWYELEFADFTKEINNSLKKGGHAILTIDDEMKWMKIFELKGKEIIMLKIDLEQTSEEIDQLVYDSYGLTEDEIKSIQQG
ncbi:MAG: N-6 DNA methylase [Flavobacteriales bacterium]|nr:N-6 DNA methylase [Flavobacteriales bacterium]